MWQCVGEGISRVYKRIQRELGGWGVRHGYSRAADNSEVQAYGGTRTTPLLSLLHTAPSLPLGLGFHP